MSILSCNVGALSPFENPEPELDKLLDDFLARIQHEEKHVTLDATNYEKRKTHIKRFLVKHNYDFEGALTEWHSWVSWRHAHGVDSITEEEIVHERAEGILQWRGRNKEGMKCCVVTARFLHPELRRGTARSYKRYLIKSIEDGLRDIDEDEQDKVCIIYDRRNFGFEHIDPNLFNFCKQILQEMRDFYSPRIGYIYILHVNLFFWVLYMLLVYPTAGLLAPDFNRRFIMLDKPQDLLKYFDEEEIQLPRDEDHPIPSTHVEARSTGAAGPGDSEPGGSAVALDSALDNVSVASAGAGVYDRDTLDPNIQEIRR